MSDSNPQDLPIFVKWVDFLKWLLMTTEKFPKKARFTFADRINRMALDVVEDLVEARYSRQKLVALKRVNLQLEKIGSIRISPELFRSGAQRNGKVPPSPLASLIPSELTL